MTPPTLTVGSFESILPRICDKNTSSDPDNWTSENPLWGHCAVVSLVAQNIFGGELFRASLENTEFAAMRSHYWNTFGMTLLTEWDFTAPQFRGRKPALIAAKTTRSYILYDPKTGRMAT